MSKHNFLSGTASTAGGNWTANPDGSYTSDGTQTGVSYVAWDLNKSIDGITLVMSGRLIARSAGSVFYYLEDSGSPVYRDTVGPFSEVQTGPYPPGQSVLVVAADVDFVGTIILDTAFDILDTGGERLESSAQEGDVYLFQTTDGGNINVVNGVVKMNSGLESAVYMSLFGGNEDDDGRLDNRAEWWGNIDEPEQTRQQRSETQHLLQALVMSSFNLRRVEDAIRNDLAWMVTTGAATSVEAAASIIGLNKIKITVNVVADDREEQLVYIENWKAEI